MAAGQRVTEPRAESDPTSHTDSIEKAALLVHLLNYSHLISSPELNVSVWPKGKTTQVFHRKKPKLCEILQLIYLKPILIASSSGHDDFFPSIPSAVPV